MLSSLRAGDHQLATLELGSGRLCDGEGPVVIADRRARVLDTRWGEVVRVSMKVTSPARTLISEAPTAVMRLAGTWTAHAYTSAWGAEFEPVAVDLGGDLPGADSPGAGAPGPEPWEISSTSGRSSNQWHPWLALTSPAGAVVVAPAWSGNWSIRVRRTGPDLGPGADLCSGTTPSRGGVRHLGADPGPGGGSVDADGLVVEAGISPWKFSRQVTPDRPFRAPDVLIAWGQDLPGARAALADAVGRHLRPRTPWSEEYPTEWNHWWPYEDAGIDETVFGENADIAARLGTQVATLDAGWFGPASDTFWERIRGDWDQVNTARFPSGLAPLADRVRAGGQEFGIWIEPEAVGPDARLAREHPEILARRDDDPPTDLHRPGAPDAEGDPGLLGYVCLGSPGGREHMTRALEDLTRTTGCRWIKMDMNLDPWAGCSRTDHGHDAGDGLYEHYLGLYAVLDDFRARHPGVIVESCSSGGLRLDLGIAEHVHCMFLSDPDWTEHHLQVLWGGAGMFPAASMLHWSQSQWRGDHPHQNLDVRTVDTVTFDRMVRAAMVHRFGISLPLPDLPTALRERLAEHLRDYRRIVPLLADGVLWPLTDQPLRRGRGERFPAFQLRSALADAVLAVRLDDDADDAGSPAGDTVAGDGGGGDRTGAAEAGRTLTRAVGGGDRTGARPDAGAPGTVVPIVGVDPHRLYRVDLLGPDADLADLPDVDPEGRIAGSTLAGGLRLMPVSGATSWLAVVTPDGTAGDERSGEMGHE